MKPLCTPDLAVKSNGEIAEAHPVRCKRWSSPVCAEVNRAKVIGIAIRSKPKAMLTLTLSTKGGITPDEAALRLKEGLRLLRLRLKRHQRLSNFEFMAIFERHKSGFPHLHLLIRGSYIPIQWLKRTWEEITGSFMVDIRDLKGSKKRIRYVAKYLGKDLAQFQGCKRWWRSHGFSVEDDTPPPEPRFKGKWHRTMIEVPDLKTALAILRVPWEEVGREGVLWRKFDGKLQELGDPLLMARNLRAHRWQSPQAARAGP